MKSELLSHFPALYLTYSALFIFFLAYIGVCIWLLRPHAKRLYLRAAHLPLEDDNDQN